jgi:hypothetical protein
LPNVECTNNKADNEARMMKIDIAIDKVFPDVVGKRTQVVFRELLKTAESYAKLRPDRDLIDLIHRARLIAASFDGGVK